MGQLLLRLQRSEANNYDARRFSFDGVDRSCAFDLEYHKENLCFFILNYEKFEAALSLLEDEASRALFRELILFRLAGHLHIRLPTNTPRYWEFRERASANPSQPSHFDFKSVFGPLRHYEDVELYGRKFSLDCWPDDIASTSFIRQYHLERGDVRIFPEPENHVIDAGSCFGDTAVSFAGAVGPGGRVYAFDPLQSHGEIIRHNIAQNGLEKTISFFPVGLGGHANDVPGPVLEESIVNPGFRPSAIKPNQAFPVRTIDSLAATGEIPRVDFVKMDIEGSELAALRGAEKTLRRFQPKLAISIYHKFGDFFEIPLYLHGLSLGYRFYLGHYTIFAEETVLYAAGD
jgi:FkbM family methyltransferase